MRRHQKLVQWTNFPPSARSVSGGLYAAASVSLLLLSGCDKLPLEAEEARSRFFYEVNKPAYEALEEALHEIDPEIRSVMSCNTDTTDCFVRSEGPSTAQLAAEARYAPLMRDLGFPGHIFFDQHDEGEFVFPNMGHAEIETENGIYEVDLELVLWLNGVPTDAAMCEDYDIESYSFQCLTELDGNWFIRRRGFNHTVFTSCSEKHQGWMDSPNEDDRRAYYECLGIPPPWEPHEAENAR